MRREKQQIREEAARRLSGLSREEIEFKSLAVYESIRSRFEDERPDLILSYISMRTEVQTRAYLAWARETGTPLAVPRIAPRSPMMEFHLLDNKAPDAGLELHPFGFLQPKDDLPKADLSRPKILMLVPGAAFTLEGVRVGRGGGFYDRFLALHNDHITTAGICFSEQIFADLPAEEHDIIMDTVVTD